MNKKSFIKKAIALLSVLSLLFTSCFITISAEDSSELLTTVLLDAESDVAIYGATRQNTNHIYSGDYSFYSSCSTDSGSDYNQWGLRANAQMFDMDFTNYLSNGAIVFWAYVDGDVAGVTANYRLYLQSTEKFSWDAEWYYLNVKDQLTASNSWNRVVVPLGSLILSNTGTNKSAVDLTSIKCISIHTYGGNGITDSVGTGVDIYLDNFIAVSDINKREVQNNTIKTTTLLDMETSVNIYGASRSNLFMAVKHGNYGLYSSCDPGSSGDANEWGFRAREAMFNADLSDYTEKGALVFWMYVDGSLSGVSEKVIVKLNSDGGHNWDNGHSFNIRSQITKANAWNRIVIPFSEFKMYGNGADFSSLTSISIQCYSPKMTVDAYYDDFIAVSDYQLYLETHPETGYIMLDDCEETTLKNIYGPAVSVKNTKNGNYSYYSSSTSGDNGAWVYRSNNQSFGANISSYIERGAFAFWMYVDGEPANIGSSINCWLTADTSYSNYFAKSKNNGYKWNIPASDLKSGWNAVILPFSEAQTSEDSTATDDFTNPTNINSFSLICVGKRTVDLWIDCYAVIDNYTDGMPAFAERTTAPSVVDIPVSAEIAVPSTGKFAVEKAFDSIDISAFDPSNMRLVIEAEVSGGTGSVDITTASQIELTSSGKCDVNEVNFSIKDTSLKQGKNIIKYDLSEGYIVGGKPDLSKINYFRMYTLGATVEENITVKITDVRIECSAYSVDDIFINEQAVLSDEANSFVTTASFQMEDLSGNASLLAEFYINGAVPENITADFALSSDGAADTNYISATVSNSDLKLGKNIMAVPISDFTAIGTVDLDKINFASLSFTATGIDGSSEINFVSAVLCDSDKLAAASTNNKFVNSGIDADTAVMFIKADFAENESGVVKLTGSNGEAAHRFNAELLADGELVLALGDFIAADGFDFNSVNVIEITNANGSAIEISELYILNNCNAAVAKTSYMPTLFTDNMMFRQNAPIKLWGFTAPLSDATATLYKGEDVVEKVDVISDADGRYDIEFSALKGGYDTYSVVVTDAKNNTYNINNILIGEIWLSGGQSNMEYTVGKDMDSATLLSEEYLGSDINSAIRVFLEPSKPLAEDKTYQPISGVNDIPNAYWELGSGSNISGMSSLAYTFARELRAELDVPVGIINTAVGGTVIETWISRDYIYDAVTDFSNIYYTSEEHVVSTSIYSSGALYHQKIEALEGFGISGTIWYQGESNSRTSYRYAELLSLLKSGWSDAFGFENNSMPFIFTQVAPDVYDTYSTANKSQHTAYLSEQMEQVYRANIENNMAMVTIYDLPLDHIKDGSSSGTIHPRIKTPVGERFALSAINLVYGGTGENSTPIYDSKEVKDGAVYVKFTNVGEGLKAISGDTLHGFAICGADNVYASAYAEIVSEDTVKVWNPLISEPCEVTYAFETMNQSSNLANSDGIPASPFRTKIYNDRVGVADDTVTYYNTQEWMFADKDYWQNIKYASAAVSELWTVSDTAAIEYSSEHFTEGTASLKVNLTAENTATLTPKANIFGSKDIDFAKYGLISVDVYSSEPVSLTLKATTSDGNEISLLPVNYETTAVELSGANCFNTLVFKPDNTLSLSGISFEISAKSDAEVYIDNITVGTDSASAAVIRGDSNGDKQVDIIDLIRTKKYLADTAEKIYYNAADCDNSGDINAADLTALRRILLG